jgi:hypothetical protein
MGNGCRKPNQITAPLQIQHHSTHTHHHSHRNPTKPTSLLGKITFLPRVGGKSDAFVLQVLKPDKALYPKYNDINSTMQQNVSTWASNANLNKISAPEITIREETKAGPIHFSEEVDDDVRGKDFTPTSRKNSTLSVLSDFSIEEINVPPTPRQANFTNSIRQHRASAQLNSGSMPRIDFEQRRQEETSILNESSIVV